MPIQCKAFMDRPTTLPARWRVGNTAKAEGASTKAKKINPPTQTTRDNSIR